LKLELLINAKREEKDETSRHRKTCGDRLDAIETYIDIQKATDKTKSENAISKSALSGAADIIKTIATVITVLIAMKILHF